MYGLVQKQRKNVNTVTVHCKWYGHIWVTDNGCKSTELNTLLAKNLSILPQI
jgi:hypothetical protein